MNEFCRCRWIIIWVRTRWVVPRIGQRSFGGGVQIDAAAEIISKDEHNNSDHYRPELPFSNRSYKGEDFTDGYFGDHCKSKSRQVTLFSKTWSVIDR